MELCGVSIGTKLNFANYECSILQIRLGITNKGNNLSANDRVEFSPKVKNYWTKNIKQSLVIMDLDLHVFDPSFDLHGNF